MASLTRKRVHVHIHVNTNGNGNKNVITIITRKSLDTKHLKTLNKNMRERETGKERAKIPHKNPLACKQTEAYMYMKPHMCT